MDIRQIIRKATGIALAGALVFGAFEGSASAAQVPEPQGGAGEYMEAPTITKEVTGGYFGGGEFTFTLEKDAPFGEANYPGWTQRTLGEQNLIGLGNNVANLINTITVEAGAPTGSLGIVAASDIPDTVLPGVYRYAINETNPNISGMNADNRTLYIDVFVENTEANRRVISRYIVSDGTNKTDLKFTNQLDQEDIVITKQITGNQANLSDEFTFTITVTSPEGTTNNSIRYSFEGSENAAVVSGTPIVINNVGNNDTITLSGLAADDNIEIYETDSENRGYTATARIGNGEIIDLGTITSGVPSTDNTLYGNGNSGDITIINNKQSNIPTGLLDNTAPFVLIIGLVGIFGLIYFRKNKKEKEELI